jgi:hypothetical protein
MRRAGAQQQILSIVLVPRPMPAGDRTERRKLSAWFDASRQRLLRAQRLYESVAELGDPYWVSAGTARSGQLLADSISRTLRIVPPPPPPAPPQVERDEFAAIYRDNYCDLVSDHTDPLTAGAVEVFTRCLTYAAEQSVFSEWTQLCERELNRLRRKEHPLASEIRAQLAYLPPAIDVAPAGTAAPSP